LCLAEDLSQPFGGVQLDVNSPEFEEYRAWRRGLSWRDKIAIARDDA
jgi:hypothetical protein